MKHIFIGPSLIQRNRFNTDRSDRNSFHRDANGARAIEDSFWLEIPGGLHFARHWRKINLNM